jgi:HK97 family phage major capsid protein
MSNFENARKAHEERRAAIEAFRAFADETEGRELSEEDKAKFERMNADIDAKEAAVTRALREAELDSRSAELDALIGVQSDAGMRSEDDGLTPIEREARDLWNPEARKLEFGANQAEVNRLYRRDLLAGTATDGAELVPTTLFGQLYVSLREGATSMFSLGRSVITQSGEALDMSVNTAFSTAALIAEAGTISESDPQFGTVTLNAYKYGLAIQISPELEADNAVPGALPWVVDQAVEGIRRGVGAHLITGDGSSKPNGVDNGTTTSTATGVTFPTGDNLIDAYHDIASPYRREGVWVFNDETVAGIRKIKAETSGVNQYLWQPGLQAGQPDTLLGRPVFTDSSLATVGSDAKIGLFGDLRRGYAVRTVAGIRAERSVDYAFLNDLVTWRFLGRFDGEIIDNAAYTVITNENS